MKKRALILFFILAATVASAQTLRVDAPNVVALDETVRVTFTADDDISDFSWDVPEELTIVWGPQKGYSSSTNIVNGKRTTSKQYTYTYLLQATSTGKYTLPAATATVGKSSCSTSPKVIEVVASDNSSSTSPSGAQQSGGNDAAVTGTVSSDDVFMRLTLNKTNVMKGEPINATLKLYTRADISGFEDIKFPTFNGFWSRETVSPQNIEFVRENVDGKIYNVAVLRGYMLIPQKTGAITIDPAEIVCLVRIRGKKGGNSIFDDFFDSYQTIRKRITTPSVTVNVKPLPAGAPASFAGGVGEFNIKADVNPKSVSANEAASLTITITGNGNISMLEQPKVKFPEDFEVYDLKSTENIGAGGISGSKTFEYPFIPRSTGDYKLGPIEYSYYDTKKGGYVTVATSELEVSVSPGTEVSGGGVALPGISRQAVKNIGNDVRYIATGSPRLEEKSSFVITSPLFYILALLIVALTALASYLIKKNRALRSDVVGRRNRKANNTARMRLKTAEGYLKQQLPTAYYEELHKAVLGYVADKLMIPVAGLSKENIGDSLLSYGVESSTVDRLMNVIDSCEYARYAPDSSESAMTELYNEAVAVIAELEGRIKMKKNNMGRTMLLAALLSTIGFAAAAQAPDSLWKAGNDHFAASEFDQALSDYLDIEKSGETSSPLCYNIANAYYKLGDVAHSILYYERALRLQPGNGDAANNLAIARESVLDKIDEIPPFILVTWTKKVNHMLSSDGWAWLCLALFAAAALLWLGFRHAGRSRGRKLSFIFGCIALILSLISLLFSLSSRRECVRVDEAVITSPYSSIKSSPDDAGKTLFILHDGTKVEIKDNVGEWSKVEIADGRQGWIKSNDIEII